MNVIGIMGTPFSPAQMTELREKARESGYALLPVAESDPDTVLEPCEILVGYFPERMLKHARSLRWYQLPCAGANKYVSPGLYAHNDFTLTNSSGAFGSAIAEHLIMGTLMLMREMPAYHRQQQDHIWHRRGDLRFLRGSRVAILGTGNLGGTFAEYCRALGAHPIGVNRKGTPGEGPFQEVFPMDRLYEAIHDADVVAGCLPLTPETKGLMNRAFFAAMKPGSLFLNVGRGPSVEEDALMDALQSGQISGAMVDVTAVEPLPDSSPLWDMENVIITPHISGSDKDPQNIDIIFRILMDNLTRYFGGQSLQNVVDRNKGY